MLRFDPPPHPDFTPDEWDPDRGAYYRLLDPKDRSCLRCPFLTENFGKTGQPPLENAGTYKRETRRDLWHIGCRQDGGSLGPASLRRGPAVDEGLRSGYPMICHIRREDFPAQRAALGRPARPAAAVVHACTSAMVLQQRELLRWLDAGQPALTDSTLTLAGMADVASRMLGRTADTWITTRSELRSLTTRDLLPYAHPALLDKRIGLEEVAPLSPRELRDWGSGLTSSDKAA